MSVDSLVSPIQTIIDLSIQIDALQVTKQSIKDQRDAAAASFQQQMNDCDTAIQTLKVQRSDAAKAAKQTASTNPFDPYVLP